MQTQAFEYQHFSTLVERVAVYTERLENVCRSLEQYKVEIRSDIKDIDDRVKVLEKNQTQHNAFASAGKYFVGAIITALTMYLYYKMGSWK